MDVTLTVLLSARDELHLRSEENLAAWTAAVAWHGDQVREASEAAAAAESDEQSCDGTAEESCDDTAEEERRAELRRAQRELSHVQMLLQEKWWHADDARRALAHQQAAGCGLTVPVIDRIADCMNEMISHVAGPEWMSMTEESSWLWEYELDWDRHVPRAKRVAFSADVLVRTYVAIQPAFFEARANQEDAEHNEYLDDLYGPDSDSDDDCSSVSVQPDM